MSKARQCPFVLSFDAIVNLEQVFAKFSEKEYRVPTEEGTEYKHFRPELHMPTQLYAHAYAGQAAYNQTSLDYARSIIRKYHDEQYPTGDGDVAFGLPKPYVRMVLNGAHGIRRDPTVYGEQLVPTQLLIAHADRLAQLLRKERHENTKPEQSVTLARANVTVVTNFPLAIDIATFEGFQVWNYADGSLRADGATPLDQHLMKLGLVETEKDPSTGLFTPTLYDGTDPHASRTKTTAKIASELIE